MLKLKLLIFGLAAVGLTAMDLSSLAHSFCYYLLPVALFGILYRLDSVKRRRCTGIKPYPFLGLLPQYISNRHRFLDWVTETLIQSPTHTMSFVSPGQVAGVLTADPANVEHILKTNFDNYPKGARAAAMLIDFLGHGIFNSDGDAWRWQRKQASFEFSKKSLRSFVVSTVQNEIAHRLLPLLSRASAEEETVDLQDLLERFGFNSICKVAFNEDPDCLSPEAMLGDTTSSKIMKAFEEAQNLVVWRFLDVLGITWRVKKVLNIGSERKIRQQIAIVHDYATAIVRARMAKVSQLDDYHDLLSRFAADGNNTEEFLRDVVTNFLIAGRETTSSALTWFFWILSRRPDVEHLIREEVGKVRAASGNAGAVFGFEELHEMHYLHAVLTESMRLYPPAPMDNVSCLRDDVLPDGTYVGKGWFVSYCAFSMGRLESVWGKDCNDFRPERWLEEGVFRPENPFRYPVFHAGPRMCLGKEMAYIQMKSVVASVVERFKIEVAREDRGVPEHVLSMTMRMKGGLPVKVKVH